LPYVIKVDQKRSTQIHDNYLLRD